MALKFGRGTTAQKSGSLAFGEPYVNTTLGTLQIGLESGDATLTALGTGSNIVVSGISGSSLNITGNAKIDGNLTLGGAITIGDAAADTVNVIASLSSSLIPQTTNAFDLGSSDRIWRDLYISTGSIKFVAGTTVVKELSLGTLTALEAATGSSNVSITNLNSFSGSQLTQNIALATITGSLILSASADASKFATLATLTGSNGIRLTNLESTTASLNTSVTNLNTFSGSTLTRLTALEVETSNLEAFSSSALTRLTALEVETSNLETFSGSQLGKDVTLATYTGSVETRLTQVGVVSGSLIVSASNLTQRVGAIEAVSGTFARTNSTNVFTGNQTITGSLTITQDLIVGGSSSIQNISSSNLIIGAAYVTLNTATPSSRFAGLVIIDSGSVGGSGSFLYDALQDELIFVHRGNGTNVTSSVLLMGPQTYDNLGNETYLTNNRIVKSAGLEHLNDSQISDDGSTVSIPGALTVTGNITGPIRATNGVVSGSSQIVGSSITTNTITIGSTSTALGGTSTTLAGLTSVSSTGFTGALTGNASTATTLQTARTINGTSFDGSTNITIANLVSGSSQITATSTTGFATGVKTQLDANTVVSGSSQVIGILSSLNTYTGSNDTTNASQNTSITNLNTYTSSFAAASVVLTNKTISGATNTLSNIANASLTNSSVTVTAGTGMSGGGSVALGSTITLTNAGVTSNVAGTGISVSGATGAVTITNSGVTSAVAGTGVSVSGATGAVTFSIGQSVATSANAQFNSLGIGMAASVIAGRIDATNDIVAFSSSDIRFKENIKPIENALDKIRKISGNTYDWKEENKVEHGYEGNDVGVIAQEVEAILPQLVQTRESGYKAVKYDKLVALLIEGIKEQQLQIEDLKIEIKDLKKQKGL